VMKRITVLTLSAFLFLFSCKKEHSANPPAKEYKVSFNVSGFTQQIVGSIVKQQTNGLNTNAVTGLAASADFLYYRVYDFNTGGLIHQINQDSSMANFGGLTDYLPAGKYAIVFAASKPAVSVNNSSLTTAGMSIPTTEQKSWPDVFYLKDTVTVTGETLNQNVALKRVVGQLTIKLNDIFPASASKINVFITQELKSFSFFNSSGGQATTSIFNNTVPDAVKTKAGYKWSIFMMNNQQPFSVTITCYDSANKILAQSVIPGVAIQSNTQTILQGNLFGSGADLHIGINQPFDPNPINVQF
jgi:hypothetical protein